MGKELVSKRRQRIVLRQVIFLRKGMAGVLFCRLLHMLIGKFQFNCLKIIFGSSETAVKSWFAALKANDSILDLGSFSTCHIKQGNKKYVKLMY